MLHWHYWLALCSLRPIHCPHHSLYKCIPECSQHSFWTAWPLMMGPVGCPEMPVTVNLCWAASQKIKDLIYSTVEAWNHAWFWSFFCVCGARILSICMQKCPALPWITSMEREFFNRKGLNLRCIYHICPLLYVIQAVSHHFLTASKIWLQGMYNHCMTSSRVVVVVVVVVDDDDDDNDHRNDDNA